LRSFHLIYVLMFLLPVNLAARRLFEQRPVVLRLSLVCLCAVMFIVERQTYPASPRIEWPWGQSDNPWRQAFDWVRSSTPKDAVFALGPDYMDEPSEDSLGFRAYAERASLADRCTDGGVTAVFPQLAPEWFIQTGDTAKLDEMQNNAETNRLQQDGATWMITPVQNSLNFDCPYRNNSVAVCRLTAIPAGIAVIPKPALHHSSRPASISGSD
jgi:hypothetical protein